MKTYDMTLVIEYEGGLDRLVNYCYREFTDGTICARAGEFLIDLSREAPTLEDAIKSAISSAKAIGITIKKIQFEADQLKQFKTL